jgi:hypothetical protein
MSLRVMKNSLRKRASHILMMNRQILKEIVKLHITEHVQASCQMVGVPNSYCTTYSKAQ